MLLCGLISPEHFPHFSQNEQEELVPLVVFNCQFDPLEAGDELLRACRGKIMTDQGVRHVYVRSYRDVEGDELYTFTLVEQ